MNLSDIKQVYFLGIGGIGMSAIARYFNSKNIPVSGYDKTKTELTYQLEQEGIKIHYHDSGSQLADVGFNKNNTLVILTPAIPKNHEEWNWFKQNEFTILKRSQVLGLICDAYKTAGVAGTHGKTTTSTLLAHLFKQSHIDCAAFLGGISTNYETNLLCIENESVKEQKIMVVEADEFDRSFLTLNPYYGIITSTDADHLDIYGEHQSLLESFALYAQKVSGKLYIKKELELYQTLKDEDNQNRIFSYSIKSEADIYATDIKIVGDKYIFNLHTGGVIITDLYLGIPGLHNLENAVAASAIALSEGITEDELRTGLASFKGVKRRFEYIYKSDKCLYIDDYAHHPTELTAIISSIKAMYPNKKLLAIFQPHLFSRTKDFAQGFSESLSLADEIILLDIYPARELPMPGVHSGMLMDNITTVKQLSTKEEVLELIKIKSFDILLTVGAGDIDTLVNPIKNWLLTSIVPDGV